MLKITFLTFYIDYSVGVYVLSSILKNAGYDVSVIFFKLPDAKKIKWFNKNPNNMDVVNRYGGIIGSNVDVNQWTEYETELLINQIKSLSTDVLLISSRSTHRSLVADILPKIRSKCKLLTIAGGYGPTLEPEFYVDLVDYVFMGEAENQIVDLMSAIEQGTDLSSFDNLVFRRGDSIFRNRIKKPGIVHFRQEIPESFFYIDNNKIYTYADRENIIRTHAYSTFYGRGCISTCSYCSAGHWRDLYKENGIFLKKRRNRKVEDVIDELTMIKNDYTFVHFRDEFLCDEYNNLKRFFRLYEKKINVPFWAYLVPDQILTHPDLLQLAVDAGFVDTEIGFQSGSDRINRKVFTRHISNKRTLEYTRLLSSYDINMRYDFIIFNPAETIDDIKTTFDLLQALPKERSYLALNRLFYFPVSPIRSILKEYDHINHSFEYYYAIALLYLICFVMPKNEFEALSDLSGGIPSWEPLYDLYTSYLRENDIEFVVGTHDIPDSITTHRYQRILKKHKYTDVIVYGDSTYYQDLSHIFDGVNVRYIPYEEYPMDSEKLAYSSMNPNHLKGNNIPIFICSQKKKEIKKKIGKDYPGYKGRIYV